MSRTINVISTEEQQRLIKAVLNRYCHPVSYSRDCDTLAEAIREVTGKLVSPSTLRRFFGFVPSRFSPAVYTLDMLSEYAQNCTWKEFLNPEPDDEKKTDTFDWPELQQKAQEFSKDTLSAIRNRCGIRFENTIERRFAIAQMKHFLKNNHTVTAFIAPGGYGKSIMMAQLYQRFFAESDDLVWFLDAGALASIMRQGFDLKLWLLRKLGVEGNGSFFEYFSKVRSNRKGRLVLMLDALDEEASDTARLTEMVKPLIELIASSKQYNWFRVVLSTRLTVWQNILHPQILNANQQSQWHPLSTHSSGEKSVFMPAFSVDEIKQVLKKSDADKKHAQLPAFLLTPQLRELMSIPLFLQLWISSGSKNSLLDDEIDLMIGFVNRKVYESNWPGEKEEILNTIIDATGKGLLSTSVDRPMIKDIIQRYPKPYKQLLTGGMLVEEKFPNKFGTYTIRIKFIHQNFFELLLCLFEIYKNNGLDYKLLEQMNERYVNTALYQPVMKWLVLFAFKYKNHDLLKNIFHLRGIHEFIYPEDAGITTFFFQKLSHFIGLKLRYENTIRDILYPHYAADPLSAEYYFENWVDYDNLIDSYGKGIELYLNHKHTTEAQLFGNSILIQKCIMQMDVKKCDSYLFTLNSLALKENLLDCKTVFQKVHPLPLARWLGCKIVYEKCLQQNDVSHLIGLVGKFLECLPKEGTRGKDFPRFHQKISDYLLMAAEYQTARTILERAFNEWDFLPKYARFGDYHVMMTNYGIALAQTGDITAAREWFPKIDPAMFLYPNKLYYTIFYMWLQYLISPSAIKRKKIAIDIKKICTQIGFEFFQIQILSKFN